ncbi:MAG: 4,5-DOPA dioxygenase extradiol [Pseudomonadota bacterium]|nr:4,5-DOPA dioxygenase extradiol [Pseudomonadota bacterium]
MLAITDNPYADAWQALGRTLPRPRAIVAVSAHWFGPGTAVTAQARPQTIHDFGGFPRALFEVQYPAPGDPTLAQRLVELLAPQTAVRLSEDWGLDHGSWSVLRHLYPAADIPVVQLSLDARQSPDWHFALGRRLAPLRDEGVLLLGSGNLVHHLGRVEWRDNAPPHPWASSADQWFAERIAARDFDALCRISDFDAAARLAVPSPDHYLPLLHVLGASDEHDRISFPIEGIDLAAISMRSCLCQPGVNR